MQYLRIKNYEQYQHYKDRNPPWIKLYRAILNDYELRSIPLASRLAYVFCLIIASETDNRIPNDYVFLSARFGFEINESVLTPLIDTGFLLASGARRLLARHATSSSLLCLSDSSLHSLPPKSDLKSNGHAEEFEQFWRAYPKKVGKKKAQLAWKKAGDRPEIAQVIRRIEESKRTDQWTKDNGQFIPHPSTWINEGRWDDEPTQTPPSAMEKFLARSQP